jgi:hypothetical protein
VAGCAEGAGAGTALLLVDEEARGAGVSVEIDGEEQPTGGPLAVAPGERVEIDRGGSREALLPRPGEVIAVEGAEGRVRRDADPGQLVVRGSPEAAARFAELGGLAVSPLGDGRFLIDGENAMWTALLFPDAAGIAGWSARPSRGGWAPGWATGGGTDGWEARTAIGLATVEDEERPAAAPASPSADLAAYVGAYVSDDAVLVLDASGGLTLAAAGLTRRGSFGVDGCGLVLRFEDGAVSARVDPAIEEIRDGAGVAFRAMPVPQMSRREPDDRVPDVRQLDVPQQSAGGL